MNNDTPTPAPNQPQDVAQLVAPASSAPKLQQPVSYLSGLFVWTAKDAVMSLGQDNHLRMWLVDKDTHTPSTQVFDLTSQDVTYIRSNGVIQLYVKPRNGKLYRIDLLDAETNNNLYRSAVRSNVLRIATGFGDPAAMGAMHEAFDSDVDQPWLRALAAAGFPAYEGKMDEQLKKASQPGLSGLVAFVKMPVGYITIIIAAILSALWMHFFGSTP